MSELFHQLSKINTEESVSKREIVNEINEHMQAHNYSVVELNDQKPWGAYFRLDNSEADSFVGEFFSGLSPQDARLGNDKAELSPKILLVSPNQRLSWQYHNRRAERWTFLTEGSYNKSLIDDEGELYIAKVGDVVQFAANERHRLVGHAAYTLVAEIWQHADSENPSNEDDIVRLSDDYSR